MWLQDRETQEPHATALLVEAGGEPEPKCSERQKDRVEEGLRRQRGGKIGGGQNVTYLDVGTSIDCRAMTVSANEYQIFMSLERSWVDGDVSIPIQGVAASQAAGESHTPQFHEPIIRQYRADLSPILKDGQSFERSLAPDPLSGKTMKVEVSLSAMK